MKNSFKRRLFILLIALSLIVTQNVSYVSADETVSDPLIISADNTELSTEPVSENKGDVIVSENVSSLSDDEAELPIQESLSDNEESADIVVSENEIENNDDEEEPVLMSLDSAEDNDTVSVNLSGNILNGMPEGFVLSESELLGKKRINEHNVIEQLETLKAGEDYAPDEVIFYCNNEEYARIVANAYNGTLDSCELGVAVIKLDIGKVSVKDAVKAGCDLSNNLPPVDANLKIKIPEPVTDNPYDNGEIKATTDAVKNAFDGTDWAYWTDTYGFNDPGLDPTYLYPGDPIKADVVQGYQWMHDAVGSYRAWGVTQGEGVTVAVIDSGVYACHEDLGTDKVNTDAYQLDVFKNRNDTSGHGTHVAGIIAAAAGNGLGGAGIAPKANIIALPVEDSEGYYDDEAIIKAINYTINNGNIRAEVINMSLGGPVYTEAFQQAVSAAHDAGITVCVARGNELTNAREYPASFEGVVGVTAVDETLQKAWYSDFGGESDVAAPGSNIFSTHNGHTEESYQTDHSYYRSFNGTSLATPVVAGVCALYISAKKKKGEKADPDDVENALKKYATKISSPYYIGAGMVNAAAMLASLEETGAPVINADKTLTLNKTVSFGDNGNAGGTLGYIYTLNGKKPSASKGTIKNGYFVSANNGSASVSVTELLENGLNLTGDTTIMAARITGLGTMTDIARVSVSYTGSADGLYITGSDYIAKGKSNTYKINRKVNKNTAVWSLKEGAPSGVKINAKTGKVTVKKTSTGSFTVIAEYDGVKAEKTVTILEPAKSVTLTATINEAEMEAKIPKTDKKGNLKSIRLFNVDIASTSDRLENVISLNGKADNAQIPVEYISSKPSVAEVDENGTVTAKKAGSAKITCRATDGSGKKAVLSVKVIVPISKLDIYKTNAQQVVGYGKSVKIRAAIGSTYGKPTVKKVKWEKEPVQVTGILSDGTEKDVTSAAKDYIKIKNGKLSVNKKITSLGSYKYFEITVKVSATDGSRVYAENKIISTAPATVMKLLCPGSIMISVDQIYLEDLISTDMGYDLTSVDSQKYVEPEVISSDPKVVSVQFMQCTISENRIEQYFYVVTEKKGRAKVTIKSTDGSGKKVSVLFIVK